MSNSCNGIMGAIFGHSFRPVITKSAPQCNLEGLSGGSSTVLEFTDMLRDQKFEGVVYCKRCGKQIGEAK